MNIKEYKELLNKIEGSTIALVYVFEKDVTEGFQHYDPWKSDVISDWLKAIQELHCMPFILDVRTFAQKALTGTLPQIDYIVLINYICLFDYLFISSQMSAKPYFIGSTGILLLW